jgi:hypothetical protein
VPRCCLLLSFSSLLSTLVLVYLYHSHGLDDNHSIKVSNFENCTETADELLLDSVADPGCLSIVIYIKKRGAKLNLPFLQLGVFPEPGIMVVIMYRI